MPKGHGEHELRPQSIVPSKASGNPWMTWGVSSLALVVALTAASLFMSKPTASSNDTNEVNESPSAAEAAESSIATPTKSSPVDPLNITKQLIDAESKARLWNSSAMLAAIELIIVDGRPMGPVAFTFGVTTGQPIPGAVMSPARRTLSYTEEGSTTKDSESTRVSISLPAPDCPLDVAFRKLPQDKGGNGERLGVIYLQSERYRRPIWIFTNSSGKVHRLSAKNCALLRN